MRHHLLRPLPPTTPLQIIKFSLGLHLLSFFHISPCQSSVPPAPPLPLLSCLSFPPLLSSHLSFLPLTPHLSPPLNSINSASNYLSLLTFRTYHTSPLPPILSYSLQHRFSIPLFISPLVSHIHLPSSSHSLISLILYTASIHHPTIYLFCHLTHTTSPFFHTFSHLSQPLYTIAEASHHLPLLPCTSLHLFPLPLFLFYRPSISTFISFFPFLFFSSLSSPHPFSSTHITPSSSSLPEAPHGIITHIISFNTFVFFCFVFLIFSILRT